jgi:phosphinothricin acetyltransferase
MTEWSAPLKIRPARPDDAKEIARIYNQGVQDRAATFENAFVTPEERYLWIVARPEKFPVLVAEVKHTMMGWASLTPYSPRACYSGIAELSIYIDRSLRGHGVGQDLMKAMQEAARERGFYKIVGRVMADNEPARKLCQLMGWREVGVHAKHGKLGNAWHDLVLVEFLIPENMK